MVDVWWVMVDMVVLLREKQVPFLQPLNSNWYGVLGHVRPLVNLVMSGSKEGEHIDVEAQMVDCMIGYDITQQRRYDHGKQDCTSNHTGFSPRHDKVSVSEGLWYNMVLSKQKNCRLQRREDVKMSIAILLQISVLYLLAMKEMVDVLL